MFLKEALEALFFFFPKHFKKIFTKENNSFVVLLEAKKVKRGREQVVWKAEANKIVLDFSFVMDILVKEDQRQMIC